MTVAAPGTEVVPAATDAVTGRAALGGRARTAAPTTPSTGSAVQPPSATPEPARTEPATAPATVSPDVPPTVSPPVPAAGGLTTDVWEQTVRPALRGMTRAVYAPATLVGAADGTVTFSLPNVAHREKCEQHREAVEAAIRAATGAPVVVQLLVEGESADVPPTPSAGPAAPSAEPTVPADPSRPDPSRPDPSRPDLARPDLARPDLAAATIDETPDDDDVDLDDLVDAPPESVKSPIDRLAEAFPGSELIDERT